MSNLDLNQFIPTIDNAGRRLILSEIMGRPKAYTLQRPSRLHSRQQVSPTPHSPVASLSNSPKEHVPSPPPLVEKS